MTVVGIVHSAGADALACRIPAWTLTDLVPAATRTASAQTTLAQQHSTAQTMYCIDYCNTLSAAARTQPHLKL